MSIFEKPINLFKNTVVIEDYNENALKTVCVQYIYYDNVLYFSSIKNYRNIYIFLE
jgi:hypothetical protein